ncbi:2-phosphosulfolactate phosphatase [Aliifodinibius sp. S!AR15-10]|uniref:2-phosphosulfolactate phosphatase n=1 Tax=Aliifodinibius sp. S!AR15-10 TaxID=2950437 RepID=UPI002862BB2F|nr:2-phosphosulfolactate phosphatase [Aliifodinibius sp. S!AR15-10]MDR8394213.1 2-phosphosulfolactate phosphatase [Aliifodinibius sp. S!AR15-10]
MNKNIDLCVSAHSFQEEELRDKVTVVIDVLRASSTIVTALNSGAKGIIPVQDMDAAGKISINLDSPNFLLCGEKDGKKIEGYDLGNSPAEYSPETVKGKTIIFKTSNGTQAIKRSTMSKEILVGTFLNLQSVLNRLREVENDIVLVCAGWKGRLALEDMLCAGNIAHELTGGHLPGDASDGVKVAFGLYEKFGNDIENTLRNSNHAKRLDHITENDDISYCSQLNTMDVLPTLKEGIITDANGKK